MTAATDAPEGAVSLETLDASPVPRRLDENEALRLGTDIQRRIGVKTSRQEPLARFTTMRVGGAADLFAEVRNLFELRAIARFVRARGVPLFILGRGSDLVISDAGIGVLVVMTCSYSPGCGPRIGSGVTGGFADRASRMSMSESKSAIDRMFSSPSVIDSSNE